MLTFTGRPLGSLVNSILSLVLAFGSSFRGLKAADGLAPAAAGAGTATGEEGAGEDAGGVGAAPVFAADWLAAGGGAV